MTEFAALRPKAYSYLTHDAEHEREKTPKSVIKRKLKFEDYKHSLHTTQLENKINQLQPFS